MTFKQLIEQELDPAVLAAEITNLDKTSKSVNNIATELKKSPDLQKALSPFQQLVSQQLEQKKMQAQQLELQKKQQQQINAQRKMAQANAEQQANTPVLKAGTAAAPIPNANAANMQ